MNKQRFYGVIGIPIALVVFLAWVDVNFFVPLQTGITETQGQLHMQEFWWLGFAILTVTAITYWLMTKDVSETLALKLTGLVLIFTGWEDIFYYFLKGLPLTGAQLPWLNTHFIIGTISNSLHTHLPDIFTGVGVTGETLIASALIGVVILIVTIPWLVEMD